MVRAWTVLGLMALGAALVASGGGTLSLAVRGKSAEYAIVVPSNAPSCVACAATELRDCLRRQTGVELPIVNHSVPRAIVFDVRTDSFTPQDEAFQLKAVPPHLLIVSGGGRGALYGAYELLERFGGCAWYSLRFAHEPRLAAFDVPDTLDLTLSVWANEPEREEPLESDADTDFDTSDRTLNYLAEFTFTLTFDPYYTAQGEVIPVNTTFTLDGQTMTLAEVELYPTHLRVKLEDDPANTAWLKGLELYLENEHGERFYASTNGISATGDPDGEGTGTFWLDSPFFSQGEHLTLCITRAKWREKSAPMTRLDLRKGTAENLPEGIRFLGAEERPGGWLVSFVAPVEAEHRMYSLFESSFYLDEAGEAHDIMQFGSTYGIKDPVTGEWTEHDVFFTESFPLKDYHGDTVYLEPLFDKLTEFDMPVSIPIQ